MFVLTFCRVEAGRVTSLCGPRVMEAVPLTAVTVMDTPTVSIPCPSAVRRSTAVNRGTWRSAPQPSPPHTAAAPTTKNKS